MTTSTQKVSLKLIWLKLLYTHLSFSPFSWCYAQPSPAPLGPKVSSFIMVLGVRYRVVSIWSLSWGGT